MRSSGGWTHLLAILGTESELIFEVEVECAHLERSSFGSDDELRAQLRSARSETRRTKYLAS